MTVEKPRAGVAWYHQAKHRLEPPTSKLLSMEIPLRPSSIDPGWNSYNTAKDGSSKAFVGWTSACPGAAVGHTLGIKPKCCLFSVNCIFPQFALSCPEVVRSRRPGFPAEGDILSKAKLSSNERNVCGPTGEELLTSNKGPNIWLSLALSYNQTTVSSTPLAPCLWKITQLWDDSSESQRQRVNIIWLGVK